MEAFNKCKKVSGNKILDNNIAENLKVLEVIHNNSLDIMREGGRKEKKIRYSTNVNPLQIQHGLAGLH